MTATARAVLIHAPGGPEALVPGEVRVPAPGPGEALVRHAAIGVNFIDVYHRSGAYPLPALPAVIGMEGAGTVEAVGEGVDEVAVGDRVAYAAQPPGAYAEARVIPAHRLLRLPGALTFEQGAAMMLQGMTARYLLRETYRVRAGDRVLVHAAAGGMGLLLCQWAKHLGATVIGTVSSDAKAEVARANGCDVPVVYTREDFVARAREATGGAGVQVVYDGIGRDTLLRSIECLAPRGHVANYGSASGPPEPLNLALLSPKAASVSRPTLFAYTASRADLAANAAELFEVVASGAVRIAPPTPYPLVDARRAHEDLEARRTTGSLILVP